MSFPTPKKTKPTKAYEGHSVKDLYKVSLKIRKDSLYGSDYRGQVVITTPYLAGTGFDLTQKPINLRFSRISALPPNGSGGIP